MYLPCIYPAAAAVHISASVSFVSGGRLRAEGSREGEFYMIFTLTHSQIHNTRYTGVQHTQPTDTLLETGELEQIVSKFSQNEVT